MSMSENEYRKLMEMPDDELLFHLRQMSAISALAEQSVDLIERQMVRIAELEGQLAFATRKADPIDPMERFRDDAHPAVTNARIAVHNAKIMGQLGSGASDDVG